jgi:hypothetical protein
LSYLNEAQLVRIQKAEWLDAYVKARTQAFSQENIESAFRGAGLYPLQPQRVLRTLKNQPTNEPTRPQTPPEYAILDKVFLNSSPPDTTTLHKANQVLKQSLRNCEGMKTPVARYVRKLADETERLSTREIIRQREVTNLRGIAEARKERKKGKRAALKGHFHISTQELRDAVVVAKKETATRKKGTKIKKEIEVEETYESQEEGSEGIEIDLDSEMDELGW